MPPPHPQIGFAYLQQFAAVEAAHRDFLCGALKLDGIIPGLGIHPKKYQFGVETMSREQVLTMLIAVEATGAAAYLGAIPFFHTKIFLTTTASIQRTESHHTAALQSIQNHLLMDKLIAGGGTPAPPAALLPTLFFSRGAVLTHQAAGTSPCRSFFANFLSKNTLLMEHIGHSIV